MAEEHPPARRTFPADGRMILPGSTMPGPDPYGEKTEMFNMQQDYKSQYLQPPLPTTSPRWRNDPAHIVLLIAIVLVVLSGGVFTVVAVTLFQQGASSLSTSTANHHQSSIYQTAPAQSSQIQGAVDAHPTFAVQAGTPGNTTGSQPPQTGTPTIAAPTATPTQFANAPFNLQIASYPQQATNHSTVQVLVTTGQANTTVQLSAVYNLPPYLYQGKSQLTDNTGIATLNWPINLNVSGFRRPGGTATASFIVRAQDQNGQVITSQTITIQILLRSGG